MSWTGGFGRACGVILGNVSDLKVESQARVLRGELPVALGQLRGQRFDLVFSDPPYALRAAQLTVDALSSNDLLAEGARVVLEMDRREERPALPAALSLAVAPAFADQNGYGGSQGYSDMGGSPFPGTTAGQSMSGSWGGSPSTNNASLFVP